MKTTIGLSQIFSQNEPKLAHLIGTLALICAVVAAIPVTLNSAGITSIPPQIITISTWAISAGAVIKLISKSFGIVDSDGNPVNPIPQKKS